VVLIPLWEARVVLIPLWEARYPPFTPREARYRLSHPGRLEWSTFTHKGG